MARVVTSGLLCVVLPSCGESLPAVGDVAASSDLPVAVRSDGRRTVHLQDAALAHDAIAAREDVRTANSAADAARTDAAAARTDVRDAAVESSRGDRPASETARACSAPGRQLPAGTCAYSACGGDPVGEWTLVAWCEKSQAASSGRLSMRADGTFEFVLDYHGGNPGQVVCLAPQTGTWKVAAGKITFTVTAGRKAFAYSGAVARGAEPYSYCVKGDSFKYVADHTQPKWVYVRTK